MEFETLLIVSGLADDHAAVREALTAAAMLVLGPAAVVTEPVVQPEVGFEFAVVTNDDASDVCLRFRHWLAEELREREIMFDEFSVRAATMCALCGNFCEMKLS